MQMISIIFSAELTSKVSGRQNKPEGKDSVQNTEALSRRDSSGNGIEPDSWMLHEMGSHLIYVQRRNSRINSVHS